MSPLKVSRTVVFDQPCRARLFFEALIADNLDLGRPENAEIIFGRRVRCDTPETLRTAIDRPVIDLDDKGVAVNVFCKHSRVKQHPQGRPGAADRDRHQQSTVSREGLIVDSGHSAHASPDGLR